MTSAITNGMSLILLLKIKLALGHSIRNVNITAASAVSAKLRMEHKIMWIFTFFLFVPHQIVFAYTAYKPFRNVINEATSFWKP